MEPLDDAVGLWALGLGTGVIDVFDREIELVFVPVMGTAELGATVGQHPLQRHVMFLEAGNDPVIEQVGGGDRGLAIVQLGERHLAVGVEEGLLVDPADALQRAHIECVLGAAIAGAFGVELAVRFLVGLGLLQRGELTFRQDQPFLGPF